MVSKQEVSSPLERFNQDLAALCPPDQPAARYGYVENLLVDPVQASWMYEIAAGTNLDYSDIADSAIHAVAVQRLAAAHGLALLLARTGLYGRGSRGRILPEVKQFYIPNEESVAVDVPNLSAQAFTKLDWLAGNASPYSGIAMAEHGIGRHTALHHGIRLLGHVADHCRRFADVRWVVTANDTRIGSASAAIGLEALPAPPTSML